MSAGKGHATRPFSWAKWDASKLWKKPNMTNTPRTDAVAGTLCYDEEGVGEICGADFARQLERELSEANAKLDVARIRVDEAIQQTKELIELYRKQTP